MNKISNHSLQQTIDPYFKQKNYGLLSAVKATLIGIEFFHYDQRKRLYGSLANLCLRIIFIRQAHLLLSGFRL